MAAVREIFVALLDGESFLNAPGNGGRDTVSDRLLVPARPALSVTFSTKLLVAATVGVPLSRPPVARVSPDGNVEPDSTAHVYGLAPPVAASWDEYATFTLAPGNVEVDSTTGVATTMENALVVVAAAEVAFTVNEAVPVVVGVPVTSPPVDRVNPAGRVPEYTAQL